MGPNQPVAAVVLVVHRQLVVVSKQLFDPSLPQEQQRTQQEEQLRPLQQLVTEAAAAFYTAACARLRQKQVDLSTSLGSCPPEIAAAIAFKVWAMQLVLPALHATTALLVLFLYTAWSLPWLHVQPPRSKMTWYLILTCGAVLCYSMLCCAELCCAVTVLLLWPLLVLAPPACCACRVPAGLAGCGHVIPGCCCSAAGCAAGPAHCQLPAACRGGCCCRGGALQGHDAAAAPAEVHRGATAACDTLGCLWTHPRSALSDTAHSGRLRLCMRTADSMQWSPWPL